MVGAGEPGRTGADDKDALSRAPFGLREVPALFERVIAEEALDGVDADGFVQFASVAGAFAGMVADAPHAGGQGVVLGDLEPSGFIVARFRMEEPRLALFSRRALRLAWRQMRRIDRPHRAPAPRAVGERGAHVERNGKRLLSHGSPSP